MLLILLNDELPNIVNSLTFKAIITPHLDMLLLLSLPARTTTFPGLTWDWPLN